MVFQQVHNPLHESKSGIGPGIGNMNFVPLGIGIPIVPLRMGNGSGNGSFACKAAAGVGDRFKKRGPFFSSTMVICLVPANMVSVAPSAGHLVSPRLTNIHDQDV